jgi:hypothetical protein
MQSTILKRGPEERKVILYKNGSAFLITCEVLASNFHKKGHTETLYMPDTEPQADFLYGGAVRFLQGYQYEVVSECLA